MTHLSIGVIKYQGGSSVRHPKGARSIGIGHRFSDDRCTEPHPYPSTPCGSPSRNSLFWRPAKGVHSPGRLDSATPWRGRGGRGRSIVSRGLRRDYALLDLGLRKTHLCRGIIAWRAILSDESDESDGSDGANDTGCVLSPSRLARNDPGGASRKGLPSRVPLPGCPILHKGAWRTGLGVSGWGAVNSFTGIRFF